MSEEQPVGHDRGYGIDEAQYGQHRCRKTRIGRIDEHPGDPCLNHANDCKPAPALNSDRLTKVHEGQEDQRPGDRLYQSGDFTTLTRKSLSGNRSNGIEKRPAQRNRDPQCPVAVCLPLRQRQPACQNDAHEGQTEPDQLVLGDPFTPQDGSDHNDQERLDMKEDCCRADRGQHDPGKERSPTENKAGPGYQPDSKVPEAQAAVWQQAGRKAPNQHEGSPDCAPPKNNG